MTDKTTDENWEKGLGVLDQVYGAGASQMMQGLENVPYVNETVAHLFADIWSRPGLSMRDKRLLVIGATTMLGRSDLLSIQLAGAIVNGELTEQQLLELPLLLLFYAGAGNTTALHQGIGLAKERAKGMKPA
jgi:4-carboxymuconolactone decarboxylase